MTRSQELALAKSMRSIVTRIAALDPIRDGICAFCHSVRRVHRASCVWTQSLRARDGIAMQDADVAAMNGSTAIAARPPILCEWCGAPATATDSDGDPCCQNCVSETVAGT